MLVPGSANPLLLKSAAAAAGGYQISRSLRFNASDSAYLSRVIPSGTSTTFTASLWIKRSSISATYKHFLFTSNTANSGAGCGLGWTDGNAITVYNGAHNTTSAVYRDVSAWYYITLSVNAGTATLYVNGVQQVTGVTGFQLNGTAYIGTYITNNYYFDGYLANVHLIDGQALTPSSFTETDATTGQLIPKAYTGSYGVGTTVATATGALPIFNTTDTYGAVKGTGVRTDASASSLVLAVPLDGTNGGTTFTDQIPTGRTSSAKTLTIYGNTNTSTTTSKFYGSSGYFDGTGDYLDAGQSSDFTIGTSDDFTFEAYINPSQVSDNTVFGIGSSTLFAYRIISGSPYLYLQGTGGILNTGTISANTWTHVTVTRSGGTLRSFINGVLAGSVSSTASFNATTGTGAGTFIGAGNLTGTSPPGYNFTGYIQEVRFYKNFAKYTAAFAPVAPSNSFYLQFADNSSNTASTLGKDTSGLGNNWTPNNFSVTAGAGNDSLVDSPTNYGTDTGVGGEVRGNYCTWNPLRSLPNLLNGNLDVSNATTGFEGCTGTIYVSSGKWYWEVAPLAADTGTMIGAATNDHPLNSNYSASTTSWTYYMANGQKYGNGANGAAYGAAFANGDIIGVALDMDAGSITFYKNGVSQGAAFTTGIAGKSLTPLMSSFNTTGAKGSANFGQRPFAYTAPSGFKALCTANLPGTTITTSGTYTGNGVADGPFVYLNGVPTAMTIGGNAVTFGTHADKLSNGFKIRTTSTTYNQNANTYSYSITTTGAAFKYSRAQPNP